MYNSKNKNEQWRVLIPHNCQIGAKIWIFKKSLQFGGDLFGDNLFQLTQIGIKLRRDILLQFHTDCKKFFPISSIILPLLFTNCSPKAPTFLFIILFFTDILLIKFRITKINFINVGSLFPAIARLWQKY
jgi:hypothetical protein